MKNAKYLIILALFAFGCFTHENEKNKFENLIGKEDVVLVLTDYKASSIPKEIALLTSAKSLQIVLDSTYLNTGWTIYPLLTELDFESEQEGKINSLPNEITNLGRLQSLSLYDLGITNLPDDFDKLKNLEVLNLAMNRLNISDELPKLKKLPKLKRIELIGNRLDTLEIKNWQLERPDLQIDY